MGSCEERKAGMKGKVFKALRAILPLAYSFAFFYVLGAVYPYRGPPPSTSRAPCRSTPMSYRWF